MPDLQSELKKWLRSMRPKEEQGEFSTAADQSPGDNRPFAQRVMERLAEGAKERASS